MIIDRIHPTESTKVLLGFEMDASKEMTHVVVYGEDKFEVMTGFCELAETVCDVYDVEHATLLKALKWYFKGAK